jgi:signal transduction histidine kinase
MKRKISILAIVLLSCHNKTFSQSAYADSLQKIIALNRHDEAERKTYSLLAIDYFKTNPAKAKTIMLQLVKMATEADDYMRLSSAYSLLLTIYKDEGNVDSAVYVVNKFKETADKVPDDYKVQGNYNQAVGLYYKKNGDYKTALPYSLEAVRLAEKGSASNKAYVGGQWLNAGDVYLGLGEYSKAMDCNLKALRLFEESGSKRGEGFCYTNLSALYNLLKQYGNALKAAQKSLEIKTQLNDTRGICTALEGIGQANMNLKNLPKAFSSYEAALKISIAEKMPIEEMTCYFNMAKIFSAEDKDSLAIVYFKKSKALALQLENKPVAANVDLELSTLYKNADDLKHTEQTLYTSLQTFRETGSLEKESDNYKKLSEFYAGNKQYDKALEFSNKFHDIKDSITGINIQVQLKKLEEQFNSEKKEKEIVLLKNEKELQQQRLFRQRILFGAAAVLLILSLLGIALLVNRNRLRQRMKELELRNQIAADLHDEVGSSLSSIHMLSQMATQPGNEITHKDILSRMSSNAKETMDKMGDIVWMIKPGETESGSLKQRMERFTYEICGSRNISAALQIDQLEKIKLSMEQRKNIYLIFKEAVNNAVKYSGTEKIEIIASVQNKELMLQVKDFGKGFAFETTGKGNGLDNMKHRAAEMSGTIQINSSAAQGTEIKLSIPV